MKKEDFNNTWVFAPTFQNIENDKLTDSLKNDLLQMILAVIQDGVCILDTDLNIIYANPTICCWYPGLNVTQRQKCYQVFHGLSYPCDVCPTLRAFDSKQPESDVVTYKINQVAKGWQQLYSVPVRDNSGNVVMIIEYVRDITYQRKAELATDFLESQNTLLVNFLEQNEKEKKELERRIATNVELSVKPILTYLDKIVGKENTDVVRRQLDISLKDLTHIKSHTISLLTPRELQIAYMIKENFLSKEIADHVAISKKTVDYHRANIRKKLNLKPTDNLRNYFEINL
jgi:DNA-binding CsgD family transcriptional regulator